MADSLSFDPLLSMEASTCCMVSASNLRSDRRQYRPRNRLANNAVDSICLRPPLDIGGRFDLRSDAKAVALIPCDNMSLFKESSIVVGRLPMNINSSP